MSNMSYCRFENTNLDLQDCIDAVEQMINTGGADEDGEFLSHREERHFEEMIENAKYYSEIANQLAELMEDKK